MAKAREGSANRADGIEQSPRLRTWRLVLLVLAAGWVPTLLMAFIAYAYLSAALQTRIQVNELNVVRTLARLVEADLGQTAEVVEFYQSLPRTIEMTRQKPDPSMQDWLASIYYSHPRIDGMFLTDTKGKLLAALPYEQSLIGTDFDTKFWMKRASESPGVYVSAAFPRKPDGRLATAIVVAVRNANGSISGYLGASVLVERIGKRLKEIDLSQGGVMQVLDQNGFPLFDRDFTPNSFGTPIAQQELLHRFHRGGNGHFEYGDFLYTYSTIAPPGWVAAFEQPTAVAFGPVRELVARITLLASWLILGTAFAAWIVSKLYKRQLENTQGVERAMLLNEKILENIPVGIAQIHPTRKTILQTNQKFAEIATDCEILEEGQSPEGMLIERFPFVTLAAFDRLLKTGESFSASEARYVSPDGRQHFHAVNLLRLRDSTGETQGILLIVEDQTPEVRLRRQLIEANTSKDQFLAVLSHELRNPLSPVITMAAELEESYGTNPETKRAIEVIRRNVELEARLIDDLLDITRIANSKLQLQTEVINAHESINRALEICQSDIVEKELAIELRLDAKRFHTVADPARLQQVFWNLIKNAIKFTPERRKITIETSNIDSRITVMIRDQGIGIPKHKLRHIFKAFEQGESSITRHFGGLGLGLAISKAMIEAHGGSLTAQSEGHGKGASFYVTLNTTEPKANKVDTQPKTSASALPGLQGKRLLLVDDHEDTSRGLSRLLQRRGMEVQVASNAREALDLASNNEFDAVLSDIGLPDRTGFELMSDLRDRFGLRGIALSGFGMESDIQRSLESGFAIHLTKPVNIERLDDALRRLLAGKE